MKNYLYVFLIAMIPLVESDFTAGSVEKKKISAIMPMVIVVVRIRIQVFRISMPSIIPPAPRQFKPVPLHPP